jgi:hypothetical protein
LLTFRAHLLACTCSEEVYLSDRDVTSDDFAVDADEEV